MIPWSKYPLPQHHNYDKKLPVDILPAGKIYIFSLST